MTPSSRYSRHNRLDRLNVSVLPDQPCDAEPQSPYLHSLFGKCNEADSYSRLMDDPIDGGDGTGHTKAETVVMKEVTAWLELNDHDEFWVSGRKRVGKLPPTTSQLLARLKDSDSSLAYTPNSPAAFDALVQAIALQLLASCYTFIPASSANDLPLFQQRPGRKLMTALRAHSSFRLSPAAGHHARAPSETSAWPGLYAGPDPEESLAKSVSQRRSLAKRSSEFVPSFTGTDWTDGTNDTYQRRRSSSSRPSSATSVLTRLTCRLSTPQNPHHKHSALFSRTLFCMKEGEDDSSYERPRKKPFQKVTMDAVQRIPSVMRLRHTQSNLRIRETVNSEYSTSGGGSKSIRRTNSDLPIGSRFRYNFEVPDIDRISTAPNVSSSANSLLLMKSLERGDRITAHEYLIETRVDRRPLTSHISVRRMPSWTENPSTFSASQTREGVPQLEFDDNGQTAADRQNNKEYGTETGHNSQEHASPPQRDSQETRKGHGNSTSLKAYLPPDKRIHDWLMREDGGLYKDDKGPGLVLDHRLRRAIAKQHNPSDDSSSSGTKGAVIKPVRRDRRKKCIMNEARGLDSEAISRFRPVMEDMLEEKQGSMEDDGREVLGW